MIYCFSDRETSKPAMTPKIRVLVWDDEPLVRMTIRLLLEAIEDLLYVGEIVQPYLARQLCAETESHILLTVGQ
jgi:DNA-binding NarL/FixJ family response regulator